MKGRLWIIANADIPGGQRLDILVIGAAKIVPMAQTVPTFGTIAVIDRLLPI